MSIVNSDMLSLIGAAGGVAAALFAGITVMHTRPTGAFHVSDKRGHLAFLKRTRRPTAMIVAIVADGATTIRTRDPHGTAEFRLVRKNEPELSLDMAEFEIGRPFVVVYRRVWPCGVESTLRRLSRCKHPGVSRRAVHRLQTRHFRLRERTKWGSVPHWTGLLK